MTQTLPSKGLFQHNPYFSAPIKPFKPLPHPVYFVTKDTKWLPVIEGQEQLSIEAFYARCSGVEDIWSAQVYLDLKQKGLNVHLVPHAIPGQICIIPFYSLSASDWLYKSYVVACHYDTAYPRICDQRIVINRLRQFSPQDHLITHRPQPNLKPRNPERGARVENVFFKGNIENLYAPFRTDAFRDALRSHDINFLIQSAGPNQFAEWSDYTEADVVIAVRNNTKQDIAAKPALKLVNAWLAGCPAILSPEPAYQELRRSDLDYIEVRTPEEAIAALKQLKQDPDRYLAMVENGYRRAQAFTLEHIQQEWYDLLSGPIAQGYEQWLQQPWLWRSLGRPIQYMGRIIAHRRSVRQYFHDIENGERILES
jgi:hypothetical protein